MAPANGQLARNQLVEVQPGMFLEAATAAAFLRAKHDTAGIVDLRIAAPVGAYRSLEVQKDMRVHPERYGIDKKFTGKLAPVGRSPHGLGLALDLVYDARSWANANFGRYGFKRPLIKDDPGHWVFAGKPTFATTNVTPTREERDVQLVYVEEKKKYYRVGELTAFELTQGQANDMARAGHPIVKMSEPDLQGIANLANLANDKLIAEIAQKVVLEFKKAGN